MASISDAPSGDLARAIYVGSLSWAMARGAAPVMLEQRLRRAAEQAGRPLRSHMTPDDARAAVDRVRAHLCRADETDADILALRSAVTLALEEIGGRPDVHQSMTVVAVSSGLILALAVLGKLKVKDGKWELVEGLPDFEKVADLFAGLFLP